MARIRTIKPEFFLNEDLAELPPLTRLLFIGLWSLSDCEGRLQDRPKRIKAEILPYDDWECDRALGELASGGFILRYEADGLQLIQVTNFRKHQRISGKEAEAESVYPAPTGETQKWTPSAPEESTDDIPGSATEADGTTPASTGEIPGKQPGSIGEVPGKYLGSQEGKRKGKEGKGREEIPENATSTADADSLPQPDQLTGVALELSRFPWLATAKGLGTLVDKLTTTYPDINLLAEARRADTWLAANPKKAKKNYGAFFQRWIDRAFKDAQAPQTLARSRVGPPNEPRGFQGIREWYQEKTGETL